MDEARKSAVGATWNVIEDFIDTTTLRGCHNASRKTGAVLSKRLVWMCIVLAVLAANTLHLALLVNEYFQFKTGVDVYFSDDSPQFPAVIFCNSNPIRRSFAHEQRLFFLPVYTPSQFFRQNNLTYIQEVVGHEPDYLQIYADDVRIDPASFKVFVDEDYLNCYYLDNATLTDEIQMLKVFANVDNQRDVNLDAYYSLHNQFHPGDGLIFALFEPGTMPPREDRMLIKNTMPFHGGHFAPVGSVFSLGLRMSQRKSPGPPYVDCTEKTTLDHLDYRYSPRGCRIDGKAMFFIENCDCVLHSYQIPIVNRSDHPENNCHYSPHCQPSHIIAPCNDTDMYYHDYIPCLEDYYRDHCKRKCKYSFYDEKTSQLPISDSFLEANIWEFNIDPMCSSVGTGLQCELPEPYENMTITKWAHEHAVAIEISFYDKEVEVWETLPVMTPVDLLSSIGGTMGLYLGISVVTVFEVSSLLFSLCDSVLKTRRMKQPTGGETAENDDVSGENPSGRRT